MMDSVENSYCRLCAEGKPTDEMTELCPDQQEWQDVSMKLEQINRLVDLSASTLPRTVCSTCIDCLNIAYEFVIGIDRAQERLGNVLFENKIKTEPHDDITTVSNDDTMSVTEDFPMQYEPVKIKTEDIDSEDIYNFSCHIIKPLKTYANKKNLSKLVDAEKSSDCEELVNKSSDTIEPLVYYTFETVIEQEEGTSLTECKKIKEKAKGLDCIPVTQSEITWEQFRWQCAYCGTKFDTVDELKAHGMQYHQACNAYRCNDCRNRRSKLDKFLQHVKRHREYLRFSCHICFKQFSTSILYQKHKSEHKTTDHKCWGCNSYFTTAAELELHANSYRKVYTAQTTLLRETLMQHTDDLTCLLCKKTMSSIQKLKSHMLVTHAVRKRDHLCYTCGKGFFAENTLQDHLSVHKERLYQCDICKKKFKNRPQLRYHIMRHDSKKPFVCEQCGKGFRLSRYLKNHKTVHSDTLPHVCKYCNKGFRHKSSLNEHVRQHTGYKPYSCDDCQKTFTNWPNYYKHMKRMHKKDIRVNKRVK